MAAGRSKNSFLNKRTYTHHKEHGEDMSYENELNKFIDDIANNTPNADQFNEKKSKKKKVRRYR